MSDGLTVQLSELIALQNQVRPVRYRASHTPTQTGGHQSTVRGRGMDFAEARNYQAGDEIRHMEWRVTARTGRPHVKVYQEERERPVLILTDFNPSMYFGTRLAFKSVVAARLAALLAWTGANQGDRIGGLLFSATTHHEFLPRSRKSGVLPMLNALCHYTEDYSSQSTQSMEVMTLSNALIRLRRVLRPGSIILLISDFYHMGSDIEQQLARLRSHHDMLAYHVCDPLELEPPQPEHYSITNGHDHCVIDTTLDSVRKTYAQRCEQTIQGLQTQFRQIAIQYEQVTPFSNLANLVHQTYPRRTSG